MLESLKLANFKAFKEQGIILRPLTLLTGLNGMGKSSVLQALLLLRQSYQGRILHEHGGARLILNGDLVQLGTGRDILFDNAEEDEIRFTLAFDRRGQTTWRFAYDRQADVLQHLGTAQAVRVYETNLFSNAFHYLQAERVGARTSFEMADFVVREQRQIGTRGQYATHFLHVYRDSEVSQVLRYPHSQSTTLLDQVAAWMSDVSPGTQIRVESFAEMDLVRLSFGFVRPDTVGNVSYYRSTNVGFGITYTLPVLVALLSAESDALLLLENPEAHLHPRGQSQIAHLVARAASAGIQVILETHSDHILNGIRIAVRQGVVAPEQVAIHFFQRPQDDSERLGVEVITPYMDKDGRLDYWPENFFDE
jgi:predicted ATPase